MIQGIRLAEVTDAVGASVGTAEAAAALNVPESTLRYWRQIGAGPKSYLVGRRVRYDVAELRRWLDKQRQASTRGGDAA